MRFLSVVSFAVSFVASSGAGAQGLASRVAQAPNGVVRMEVASRVGVCGDGRDVVGYRNAIWARNFQSIGGHWSDDRCVPGPLRVTLTVANGQVTQLRTQVGGGWSATGERVTDLGVVPPLEASAYLFSLVPQLETATGKDRLLLPAVLADDAPVIPPLLALARNDERAEHTRRAAIQWLGLLGDARVIPILVQFARDDVRDDPKGRKKGLGDAAVAALSTLEDDIGVPALIDLARTASLGTRRNAIFWLGQNGDARGFAFMRSSYSRLENDQLKEAVIQAMAQNEGPGGRWVIERALAEDEPLKLRKSALFWAGQREETPTADLLRAYREAQDFSLREHAIFVLSQRKDDAATDALLQIARADDDKRMRGKALFWLAQKNDPRVTKLIADLILK
jgi:HEAT repeat protein